MSLVDFIPDDFSRTRSENRVNIICVLLFAVVMFSVVAGAWHTRRLCRQLCEKSRDVDDRYRQAGRQVAEIQKLQKDRADLLGRADMAAKLIQPIPRYRILAALADDLPDGAAFTQIKMVHAVVKEDDTDQMRSKFKNRAAAAKTPVKKAEAKADGKKAADEAPKLTELEILINGLAENDEQVAGFLTHLRVNPMFRSVELVYSQQDTREDQVLRSFQMTMNLDTKALEEESASLMALDIREETNSRSQ